MSGEKTEQPTEKRLRDVRKKGQASKSQDIAESVCVLAVVIMLAAALHLVTDLLHTIVHAALEAVHGDHSLQSTLVALGGMAKAGVLLSVPIALGAALAAGVANAAQVNLLVSFEPVMPKFDQVNPASGLKRIFSLRAVIDLAKMIIKSSVLLAIMWMTIRGLLPLLSGAPYQTLPKLITLLWHSLERLLAIAAVAYLVIGIADYKVAHWLFMRQNRMSKDDVKRERKQDEGDPHIKGERKKIGREMVMEEPEKKAVGLSTLVVTNPTHYAVALRYLPETDALPVVVASGVDADAALVRRYAAEAGVPVVANPPVARTLYRVRVGDPIPETMFEVVAAILRWVNSVGALREPSLTYTEPDHESA
ncbi:MAG TPA: type III secretion system export apparatus subunit SctU [Trinickia sp.]